jgi:hypothetical protein
MLPFAPEARALDAEVTPEEQAWLRNASVKLGRFSEKRSILGVLLAQLQSSTNGWLAKSEAPEPNRPPLDRIASVGLAWLFLTSHLTSAL